MHMLQILNLNPRLNFIRRENCKFADIVGVVVVAAAAFFRLLLQQNTWQQSMNVQTKAFFFCQIMLFISADTVIPCRMHRTTRAFELFSVVLFIPIELIHGMTSSFDFVQFISTIFVCMRFTTVKKKIQCKSINFFVV